MMVAMFPRLAWLACFLFLAVAVIVARTGTTVQRPAPPGSQFAGEAFRFTRVAEGVYHAVGTGAIAVGCNAAIIVNPDGVLVVDSHATPAAAWALAEQLRTITDKPIRHVINTHFHWDHAHGNQVFGPDVEVIGHEFTRRMLAEGASMRGRSYESFIGNIPSQIAQLTTQIAAMGDGPARDKLREQLRVQEQYREAQASVTPRPPAVTFNDRLTLHHGGREIQLLFLGRGHTGGDIVVYLPKERIVATGDLLGAGPSYLGDGYLSDWVATLDQLRGLDFDTVLPGHGDVFTGKAKIDHFQAYLKDFDRQVRALHAQGVPAEDAARRIDLRSHADHYPTIRDVGILNHAVYRAYDEIEGRLP
jgi:cyclase